ncbi:hypothetical protein ABER75_11800 [Niallia taxi]|nr:MULTISPECIES: hypothetical protein [Niallia]MCM3216773.1 hypothetical protein [Niallia taxi]MDE5055290.1 hypothetical protein [Niallia taxi]MDK8642460.1 hypothetical protein [Niallia taxi]MED4040562.1 hypothetical protein [Niallia taxi]MED4057002.1 hypothetical protein [Niallia taxi]
MKKSIATYMTIALTAIVISTFIFGGLYYLMKDLSDDVATYTNDSS